MVKPKKPHSSKPKVDDRAHYLRYSSLAFEVVIFNVVAVWGAYRLDELAGNTVPWITIVGVLVAVVGTIFYLLKRLS